MGVKLDPHFHGNIVKTASVLLLLLLFLFYKCPHRNWEKNIIPAKARKKENKDGYTVTPVACSWAGAVIKKVTRAIRQEQ